VPIVTAEPSSLSRTTKSASGVPATNGAAPFQFASVSRLRIDPSSLRITAGDYAEDGSGGYVRRDDQLAHPDV
jgi:hypothetical protein